MPFPSARGRLPAGKGNSHTCFVQTWRTCSTWLCRCSRICDSYVNIALQRRVWRASQSGRSASTVRQKYLSSPPQPSNTDYSESRTTSQYNLGGWATVTSSLLTAPFQANACILELLFPHLFAANAYVQWRRNGRGTLLRRRFWESGRYYGDLTFEVLKRYD